jgi:deazaflavin-dependent oxidoreductase (nitroreductase family)
MPLPHLVARFNKRVTNRVTGRLATRLPGFGVITHHGRKSHRAYRTPLNVFWRGGKVIVALTYGPNTDWVRNVMAEGGCLLETRGHKVRLVEPRRFHDEQRRAVPMPVRTVLGLTHVSDFLELTPEGEPHTASRVKPWAY